MKSRSHDDAMAELYRKDPDFARQVINTILQDENGDQGELLIVLRHMTKAFGGVQAVAEQAKLNPTQLYRTLSSDGNPALSSFSAILKVMGMRLSVQALSTSLTGAQAQNNSQLADHTLQVDIENSGASASFNDAYLVSFDGGFKQYEGLDFLHLKI